MNPSESNATNAQVRRTPTATVVIVQEYVPGYRLPFFDALVKNLAVDGVELLVAASIPTKTQESRGDAATAPWIIQYKAHRLRLAGHQLSLGGSRPLWRRADAVVVGHLGSSVDTYLAILDSIRGKKKTAVWGHIESYVNKPHPVDAWLEKQQLRFADHVFAYTPRGAEFAVRNGASPEKVTAVMNTVDTQLLESERQHLTAEEITEFGRVHGLQNGKVVSFIGGIDATKRIDFLSASLDTLWEEDPEVRVLIAGRGDQDNLFDRSVERGQSVRLGFADEHTKALIGSWATAILMPGRIGLVAVDALVLGIPIVTTDWPLHAPEADYLVEGKSKFTAVDDPKEFAISTLVQLQSSGGPERWSAPPLSDMVENFREGLLRLLAGRDGVRPLFSEH